MNKILSILAISTFCYIPSTYSALVTVQNINNDSTGAYGLFNLSGVLIPVSTTNNIRIGYFSISDSEVASAWSSGNLTALDSGFVDFGDPISMSFEDGVFSGTPTANSTAFAGYNIYLYASTASDFTSTSSQYLIFKFNATFQAEVWTGGQVLLGTDTGSLLVGQYGNYSHDYGLGSGALPGYNTVATVPEPTTWVLIAAGATSLVVFRRRRQKSSHN